MGEIDLSGCGRAILLSMVKDLRKRVAELEVLLSEKVVPEEPRDGIITLFLRSGNWDERWDNVLRAKYGDEKANRIITWFIDEGIVHHFPNADSGFADEDVKK